MTATQELVVPRSIPMISVPPAAWLTALALQSNEVRHNLDTLQKRACPEPTAYLKALRSKGPVLNGRDASDNCKHQKTTSAPSSTMGFDPLAPISGTCILGKQLSRRLAWPMRTQGHGRPLVLDSAETSLQPSQSADCRPSKPPGCNENTTICRRLAPLASSARERGPSIAPRSF